MEHFSPLRSVSRRNSINPDCVTKKTDLDWISCETRNYRPSRGKGREEGEKGTTTLNPRGLKERTRPAIVVVRDTRIAFVITSVPLPLRFLSLSVVKSHVGTRVWVRKRSRRGGKGRTSLLRSARNIAELLRFRVTRRVNCSHSPSPFSV